MIPRELFDRYDAALGANARLLQEAMAAAAAAVEEGSAAWREVYPELVRRFGRIAAVVAKEFYEECRRSAGVGAPYEAVAYEREDGGDLAGDISRAAWLASSPPLPRLQASAKRRVMERADEVLLRNALADPAHPKWALVPHAGACAWCRFLGSQSFVYDSRATALAARHDNCLCTPVVDFDTADPRLDGYDPSLYREEYQAARGEAEDEALREWRSMSREERDAYRAKGRGAYDHFLRNKIVARMASLEGEG